MAEDKKPKSAAKKPAATTKKTTPKKAASAAKKAAPAAKKAAPTKVEATSKSMEDVIPSGEVIQEKAVAPTPKKKVSTDFYWDAFEAEEADTYTSS